MEVYRQWNQPQTRALGEVHQQQREPIARSIQEQEKRNKDIIQPEENWSREEHIHS